MNFIFLRGFSLLVFHIFNVQTEEKQIEQNIYNTTVLLTIQ